MATGPYYVRISRKRLTVRDASSGRTFDDEPIFVTSNDQTPKIQGIGAASRNLQGLRVSPFLHPRIIIDNFVAAEKLLSLAFRSISIGKLFVTSPIVVIHVTEQLAGGLSNIERRALRELGQGAGALETYLWEGPELTDSELMNGTYKRAI